MAGARWAHPLRGNRADEKIGNADENAGHGAVFQCKMQLFPRMRSGSLGQSGGQGVGEIDLSDQGKIGAEWNREPVQNLSTHFSS